MIERLQRALEHIEELSPAAQEDLAQQIEDMTEPLSDAPVSLLPSDDTTLPASVRRALARGGAWGDMQDDEFAFFDRIRHETPPSPPMDEQLAWLDEEDTE
ncbi:MAG TPA: hypothetical protein VFQ32_05820 [Ktedonobacterales bacterium]|nr:hypothetical protein [Ktedonobacterales bacterium]